MVAKNPRILALFDVDGTLTPEGKNVSVEMLARIKKLRGEITIGVVDGSDLVKQKEQLGENIVDEFDYLFSENGLVAYRDGIKVDEKSLRIQFANQHVNRLVNYVLDYKDSLTRQLSFDLAPPGWDKSFCLRYIDPKEYDEIHFFGDKTHPGGEDHSISTHRRTIGHSVTCPEDTIKVLDQLFP